MSKSHKNKFEWIDKNGKRVDPSSPEAIKIHKREVLDHLKHKDFFEIDYAPIVLRSRVNYNYDGTETSIFVDGELVGSVPFIVYDLEDMEHVLQEATNGDYRSELEEKTLKHHVSEVKALKEMCSLAIKRDRYVCSSIANCDYRKTNEKGVYCTL